jgi:hypothetical protein
MAWKIDDVTQKTMKGICVEFLGAHVLSSFGDPPLP